MKSKAAYLAVPGAVFMFISLGLVIVYTLVVSFWSMKGFIMVPSWTVENYVKIFLNWSFLSTILFTIKETFILLVIVLIISYPRCLLPRKSHQKQSVKADSSDVVYYSLLDKLYHKNGNLDADAR